jgi:hypothetical protein
MPRRNFRPGYHRSSLILNRACDGARGLRDGTASKTEEETDDTNYFQHNGYTPR